MQTPAAAAVASRRIVQIERIEMLTRACQKRPHVLVHRLAVESDVPGCLPAGVACQVTLDDVQLLPQIDHLPKIASGDSLDAGGRLKLIQKVWFALGLNPYTASAIFMA